MKLNDLSSFSDQLENTEPMPVMFVGHGSPMNAIEKNSFSDKWHELGKNLPTPKAILCISAHWETRGTMLTAMSKPRTIHDFGGFPPALFDVKYPAPGDPELARESAQMLSSVQAGLDEKWGLDHGTWSILTNMFPKADIPVVQLSLDYGKDPQQHYELAKHLATLRNKGILIMGSGNMVHNLRMIDWGHADAAFDWAIEANEIFKKLISSGDHQSLINYRNLGNAVQLAIPSPDHYLPLLYTLALKSEKEEFSFFNDQYVMGSLNMTSVYIGKGA